MTERAVIQRAPLCLLPGPVAVHASVRRALGRAPISHRSEEFMEQLQELRLGLCALSGAARCAVMPGSGTLANDVVAAQISMLGEPGLILSNGEFGERLFDHASRMGLRFQRLRLAWGEVFRASHIEHALEQSRARWLWAVHCETSTGVLNDAQELSQMCRKRRLKLCLDCVSSLNTTALDLSLVHLASASSGKGLGSLPGLGLVFFSGQVLASPSLPRSLDLGLYAGRETPFTHSSNLVAALHVAVARALRDPAPPEIERLSLWLRGQLRQSGLSIVTPQCPEGAASPAVTTVALPPSACSRDVGERALSAGFELSFRSSYLLRRNWIQACVLGEARTYSRAQLKPLVDVLRPFAGARIGPSAST